MQPTFTEIKKAALSALKNRWPEAIFAVTIFLSVALLDTLMQFVLMSIFKVDAVWSPFTPTTIPFYNIIASVCITVFSAVFSLTVCFPLLFGVMRWFWQVTGGANPTLNEIFVFFSEGKLFKKAVLISIGLFLRLALATIISFLPAIICNILLTPDLYNELGFSMPLWLEGLHPLIDIVKLLGFTAFIFFVSRYVLFYAVMFLEPTLSAHKTMLKAKQLSAGKTARFLGFVLSFFGWGLLCLFIVPILFVLPFFLSSLSVYGREEYREKQTNI